MNSYDESPTIYDSRNDYVIAKLLSLGDNDALAEISDKLSNDCLISSPMTCCCFVMVEHM